MKAKREEFFGEIINRSEEEIFGSHAVAEKLNIVESTVRKYAKLLERAGYVFRLDMNGGREYRSADIRSFAEMIRLKKSGLSLESSARVVANTQNDNGDMPDMSPEVLEVAKSDMQMRAFAEMQKRFLAESDQMRESILSEIRKSLPDPAIQKENDDLKKELSEMREALAKNTELVNQLLAEKMSGKEEVPFWNVKGWFSRK